LHNQYGAHQQAKRLFWKRYYLQLSIAPKSAKNGLELVEKQNY
jgi:hypothetical protein